MAKDKQKMRLRNNISYILALPLIAIVQAYKLFISPFLGQNCRFYPSCSCYAHQALTLHGPLKGSYLSVKRIIKCQPLHPGGIDLVPGTGIESEKTINNPQVIKKLTPHK